MTRGAYRNAMRLEAKNRNLGREHAPISELLREQQEGSSCAWRSTLSRIWHAPRSAACDLQGRSWLPARDSNRLRRLPRSATPFAPGASALRSAGVLSQSAPRDRPTCPRTKALEIRDAVNTRP